MKAGPWDPDPNWQRALELTEADRLVEALELVEAVPGSGREELFDEVIYLRFLTKTPLRAQDIRFLARKHAESSLIAGRLLEEFEPFSAQAILVSSSCFSYSLYHSVAIYRTELDVRAGEGRTAPMADSGDMKTAGR